MRSSTAACVLGLVFASTALSRAATLPAAQQVTLQASDGSGSSYLNNVWSSTSGTAEEDIIEVSDLTITSLLSASDEHTTLLRLLQRSKCIPLLAHIEAATLFAPTDQAWADWAERHRPSDASLHAGWLGSGGIGEWVLPMDVVLARRVEEGMDEEDALQQLDNQNWALRQHLLYHLLNYTLAEDELAVSYKNSQSRNISIHTTLLFPMEIQPTLPPTPPPGAPWLPQGGEGSLGGHGQRLRLARAGSAEGGERGKVGVTWAGEGGAEVWDGKGWKTGNETFGLKGNKGKRKDGEDKDDKDKNKDGKHEDEGQTGIRWGRNGAVVGVTSVLDPPPSLEEIIKSTPEISFLSSFLSSDSLPTPLPDSFASTPHLTIFAPTDDAFASTFDDIELHYLQGGFGAEGAGRILGGSVVAGLGKKQAVGWSDNWTNAKSVAADDVTSVSGLPLTVAAEAGAISVNDIAATAVDIFASNGVLHIIPSLLLPPGFTLLNSAEKILLSQNCTRFASLLRSANLSHTYVGEKDDGKEEPWTILAPTDDVLDMMDRWGGHGVPPIPDAWAGAEELLSAGMTDLAGLAGPGTVGGPSALASLLQFHILPGRWSPSDIKDGALLGTELRPASLKGSRQRLRVEVSDRLLDPIDWDNVGDGEIRFGGATVIGKPIKSGKSIIYRISALLSPPDDVLQTAVSDLQLSTFIAAVYAAELDYVVKRQPAVTYFAPRNRAFNNLGLAMKYLLLPEGKDDLRRVVKYHSVDGIVYSNDIEPGRRVYQTLEGGQIVVERTTGKNASLYVHAPSKWDGRDSGQSGVPANGELRPARVTSRDALSSTGVVHSVDAVVLPADVRVTVGKLVRGSKQGTMADLLFRAGLGWVLEGREPRADEVADAQLVGIVWAWGSKGKGGTDTVKDGEEDAAHLALPSYTLLCPTDKAFSRLNLTEYIRDKPKLLALLKLHIIPTQPGAPVSAKDMKQRVALEPPRDGEPLSLADDVVYQTLRSGESAYGDVAFRATGDNSWIVGVRGARGTGGTAARIGEAGRASVRWRKNREGGGSGLGRALKDKGKGGGEGEGEERRTDALWAGGMALGGGVLMLDAVLLPYEPSWFTRWGWLVITLVGVGIVLVVAGVGAGWWWMSRKGDEGYEPLEGEEE